MTREDRVIERIFTKTIEIRDGGGNLGSYIHAGIFSWFIARPSVDELQEGPQSEEMMGRCQLWWHGQAEVSAAHGVCAIEDLSALTGRAPDGGTASARTVVSQALAAALDSGEVGRGWRVTGTLDETWEFVPNQFGMAAELVIDGLMKEDASLLEEAMLVLVEGVTAAATVVWQLADAVETEAT